MEQHGQIFWPTQRKPCRQAHVCMEEEEGDGLLPLLPAQASALLTVRFSLHLRGDLRYIP